jgi:hypothetical protein
MVLSVDWLRRYFLIFFFDFIQMKISFEKERRTIKLKRHYVTSRITHDDSHQSL